MDLRLLGNVFLFVIVPTVIYIAIGLYILSLEHIKKRPGYKLPALIYFISVPSLIVIAGTVMFWMSYITGGFENESNRPPGYEIYKFLVLKDIIPRSGTSLDVVKTTQTAKNIEKQTKYMAEELKKPDQLPKNIDLKLKKLSIGNIEKQLTKDYQKISEFNIGEEFVQVYMNKTESSVSNHMNSDMQKKHEKHSNLKKKINQIKTRYLITSKTGTTEGIYLTEHEKYPSTLSLIYQSMLGGWTLIKKDIHADLPWTMNLLQNYLMYFENYTDIIITAEWGEKNGKSYTYITKTFIGKGKYGGDSNEEQIILSLIKIEDLSGNEIEKNIKGTCQESNIYEDIDDCLKEIEMSERIINEKMKIFDKADSLKQDFLASLDNNKPIQKILSNEKYYALIIGNNNYEHLEKLDAAENDAKVLASVLEDKYGFEVELLLNGDYESTVNSLYAMTNKLKQNDNLLIYYAGHGELDKAENRGYWLPVDASYDLRSKWISNTRIVDRIKATKAKHVLLMVDSCFSGTLMRSGTTPEVKEIIDEKYIERLKKKKTRLVITSGGNEPVVDSDGGQHSLFALKLIDTLKNNNSVINSQILFENIRRYVVSNADQTPERAMVHKTGHDGGDFLFFAKN